MNDFKYKLFTRCTYLLNNFIRFAQGLAKDIKYFNIYFLNPFIHSYNLTELYFCEKS